MLDVTGLKMIPERPLTVDSILALYADWDFYYPYSREESTLFGEGAQFLNPKKDIFYIIDNYFWAAFRLSDFSLLATRLDSSALITHPPIFSKDGSIIYRPADYNPKGDTTLCFVGLDAVTLEAKEYHHNPAGIRHRFYHYYGERVFHPYFEDRKILGILFGNHNLGIFDLNTDEIRDLGIGSDLNDLKNIMASADGSVACGVGLKNDDLIWLFDLRKNIKRAIDVSFLEDSIWYYSYPSTSMIFTPDNSRLVVSCTKGISPKKARPRLTDTVYAANASRLYIFDVATGDLLKVIDMPIGGIRAWTF